MNDDDDEEEEEQKVPPETIKKQQSIIDVSDNVPPSLTQQKEVLKQHNRKYDISKNNLKNGSIRSKKSKTNKIWKCIYCWKAHKGAVTTLTYNESYNMLMSTSDSGQMRLVYLCDPGKVPPMEMVKNNDKSEAFPDFIKDKLNKIFNEIQEIQSNNYPNTEYVNLNLLNDYQDAEEEVVDNDEYKQEEEPTTPQQPEPETEPEQEPQIQSQTEQEPEQKQIEQTKDKHKEVDDIFNDDDQETKNENDNNDANEIGDDFDDNNGNENEKETEIEKEENDNVDSEIGTADPQKHENTSLA
eukprot:483932_1